MKPTIYTCCQAIPKEIFDCDEDRITKQAEEFLKHQVVDAIMTALESEEQVVTLHPVTIEENGNYEVVMRQYIHMTPLIRCKDCKCYQEGFDIDGKPFSRCNGSIKTYGATLPNWFCADAYPKEEEEQE